MQALLIRKINVFFIDLENIIAKHEDATMMKLLFACTYYEYFYSKIIFKQYSPECISAIYAFHNCGLVFHLNCVVFFRMPKSKEVLSSSSDSDSDSDVDTKVWTRISPHYTFN